MLVLMLLGNVKHKEWPILSSLIVEINTLLIITSSWYGML